MILSFNMLRTGKGAMAVLTCYRTTQRVLAKLAAMFKATFPNYYSKYAKAFLAGVWVPEDCRL